MHIQTLFAEDGSIIRSISTLCGFWSARDSRSESDGVHKRRTETMPICHDCHNEVTEITEGWVFGPTWNGAIYWCPECAKKRGGERR